VSLPLESHESEYQEPVTSTDSLNVIETFAPGTTPAAPLAGEVDVTDGARSAGQVWKAETVLRGAGATAVKSAPLLSVSMQPAPLRCADVVFESVGAADVPSKKFAPS
jgi:hypothetical protein